MIVVSKVVVLVGGRQEHLSEHVHCHSLVSLYVSSLFALPRTVVVVVVGDAAALVVVLLYEIPTRKADVVNNKNIREMQIKAAAVFLLFPVLLVLLGVAVCLTSASSTSCCWS